MGFKCCQVRPVNRRQAAADGPGVTLAWNDSRKFEDRWVKLAVQPSNCVFLAGISQMYLPVAHGEGRFFTRDEATLAIFQQRGQLPLRYTSSPCQTAGEAADLNQPIAYPDNPNGSQANVAGMCDATGRVFGLMPHPERHVDPTAPSPLDARRGGRSGRRLTAVSKRRPILPLIRFRPNLPDTGCRKPLSLPVVETTSGATPPLFRHAAARGSRAMAHRNGLPAAIVTGCVGREERLLLSRLRPGASFRMPSSQPKAGMSRYNRND